MDQSIRLVRRLVTRERVLPPRKRIGQQLPRERSRILPNREELLRKSMEGNELLLTRKGELEAVRKDGDDNTALRPGRAAAKQEAAENLSRGWPRNALYCGCTREKCKILRGIAKSSRHITSKFEDRGCGTTSILSGLEVIQME